MSEDRVEFTILGRVIGTGTGWDKMEECHILIYDFESVEEYALPNGDLSVDFNEGKFEYHNEDGDVLNSFDIIQVMHR